MEEDLELIEKYLAGELTEAQNEEVKERLKTDSEFATRVQIMRDMKPSVLPEIEGFRADLDAVMEEETRRQRWVGLMIAASVVLLVVFLVNLFQPDSDHGDLYAQYFSVPAENLSTRDSGQPEENLVRAVEAYNREQFDEALKYLDQVLEFEPENPGAQFYSGICLMTMDRYSEAVENFDRVLSGDNKIYASGAMWYKGLSLLKMNEPDAAKVEFSRLSNDPSSNYADRAARLLDGL